MRIFVWVVALLACATATAASERVTYHYDALGRLVRAEARTTGGHVGNGSLSEMRHDKAGKRSRVFNSGRFKGATLADQPLRAGEALLSSDARFRLGLGFDGNLVLWDQNDVAIWQTGTSSSGDHAGDFVVLQGDGNLVLYRGDLAPAWASSTVGSGAHYLSVQHDGNLVLYRSDQVPVWASNTCCR